MARNRTDAVIIGAGAVGLSCAYFLNRAGLSVQILERNKVGQGTSLGNCGLITPSHAQPLPGPGVPLKTLKSMFSATGKLHVRPRLDTELARWMLSFWRNCNKKQFDYISKARSALMDSSRELTQKLVQGEKLDCQFNDGGLMALAVTEAGVEDLYAMGQALNQIGVETSEVDGEGLREAEPSLRKSVLGGLWFPNDASLKPDKFTSELNWACHKRGVQLQEDCEIKALNTENGKLVSAFTDRGTYEASHFIVAAGVWSPQVVKSLGMSLPIQAGMGYSLTSVKPDPCPSFPLLLHEAGVAVTPFDNKYRIGGTMEFAGSDADPNPKRFMALIEGAQRYLSDPLGEGEPEKWHGYRPMTPDDLPLIGSVPQLPNLHFSCGHNMMGMSMSVASGRLTAELVTGRKPHIDPTPFRPDRFSGMQAS
ncbi:MAG: NAD(P)/FAD-dependent oxidoreductase [Lysobacterales bacterium]